MTDKIDEILDNCINGVDEDTRAAIRAEFDALREQATTREAAIMQEAISQQTALRNEMSIWIAELNNLKDTLRNKAAVRLNILFGKIARPDDLVFLHDETGPVADLRARIRELEARNNYLERRLAALTRKAPPPPSASS